MSAVENQSASAYELELPLLWDLLNGHLSIMPFFLTFGIFQFYLAFVSRLTSGKTKNES
jgi:hypothetical protein